MASAGQRPARLAGTVPMPRGAVVLGGAARGGKVCRVESPDRALRMRALLNQEHGALHAQDLQPESASLLGWVDGLVIGMSGQPEAAQHELYMAGHS